jgi:cellulose synthase/poly-beta-1,6-N-acetylglucosamine synthase-like glycosyltransferase
MHTECLVCPIAIRVSPLRLCVPSLISPPDVPALVDLFLFYLFFFFLFSTFFLVSLATRPCLSALLVLFHRRQLFLSHYLSSCQPCEIYFCIFSNSTHSAGELTRNKARIRVGVAYIRGLYPRLIIIIIIIFLYKTITSSAHGTIRSNRHLSFLLLDP